MAKCSAITRAGGACKGTPIDGSEYCYAHHPEHAAERKRYGQRGGRAGGRGRKASSTQAELEEMKALLKGLANHVLTGRAGRADAAVANQLFNSYIRCISVQLQAREQEDLVGRMENLEDALEAQRQLRSGSGYAG